MNGELNITVKRLLLDRSVVRSDYFDSIVYSDGDAQFNDLSMEGENGEVLHICGKNDWAFLALDLLKPIKKEAEKIIKTVEFAKKHNSVGAVVLGKNDKRIMDIYFGGKDSCTNILNIPVIFSEERDKVVCLIEPITPEIPFY